MKLLATAPLLEPPLRGESFSVEHLAAHAEQFAAQQRVSQRVSSRGRDDKRFVDSFENNSRFVAAAYRTISTAVRNGEPITPAAEWVLDNYHIVEEQLREIREDLPRGFYHELPKLDEGPWAGFPRVYELAHELVVHTDSSLDYDLIAGFVEAYQRVTPLTSGEIWAVAIMLRLVLVENLRRLCGHILAAREHRRHAERMIEKWRAGQPQPDTSDSPAPHPLLLMHLMDRLRESNPEQRGICLAEVAERLNLQDDTIDDLARKEQQRLAADQVSIGNVVTSMQLLGGLDWKAFFERVSLVEQSLREDPAHVYEHMDFATRDNYRHEIERLAKRCRLDETHVARAAIELTHESERSETTDVRRRHVGFFLIDAGGPELEQKVKYLLRPGEALARFLRCHASLFYIGSIALGAFDRSSAAIATAVIASGGPIAIAVVAGLLAALARQ